MVIVKKKIVGKKTYYYLQHTIRTKKGVIAKEKYLGTTSPKELEAAKAAFLSEIYKTRWYGKLDRIKENYEEEQQKTPKSILEKQARIFSVKFTYDTNRIEGSKLTYRETSDLLEKGLTPSSKPVEDIKEAEAHEKLFYEILQYKKELTSQIILQWHKKLFETTKPDIAGVVREYQVAISGSKFTPPSPIETAILFNEFFKWYNHNKSTLHPVELAALVHLKFVTVHPFGDGNGRISRLLMNFVLNKHGFPLLNIPYENRNSYYTALERSQVKEQDHIFTQWFVKKYIETYKNYC